MKTIFALVGLALSTQVYAGAAICYQYEYAELQSMSDDELKALGKEFDDAMMPLAYGGSHENIPEFNNCFEQGTRIERILKARKEKAAESVPAK